MLTLVSMSFLKKLSQISHYYYNYRVNHSDILSIVKVSDLEMMPFLYFPEDKTEYIPAIIMLLIFVLLAYIVYRIVKKYSRNEEEKMKEFEEKVLERLEQEEDNHHRK